ncbi:MAG: FUSC family protein [Parachlamydiaceae bacterium]|nr:FUSC family protein [Parachlamydiaceae bacterium]
MFNHSTRTDKPTPSIISKTYWRLKLINVELKRAIKVGFAAAMSLFVGVWFSSIFERPDTLVSGLWCVVSAIVVLQAHLGGTYKAAWQRFLGVLIGSVLGCILTSYFGSNPMSLGAAITLTMIICTFFKLQESVRIACLTVAVIMVLSGLRPEIPLFWFGLFRFMDSCMGIFIAVVVAHSLWPSEATDKIRNNLAKILTSLSKLFEISMDIKTDSERHNKLFQALRDDVYENFENNKNLLDEVNLEQVIRQSTMEDWKILIHSIENAFDAIITLKQLQKSKLLQMLDEPLLEKLKNFTEASEGAFQSFSRQLETGDDRQTVLIEYDLKSTYNSLQEDLVRLRGNRTTRQFDWKEIESFFVFFYSIGIVAEELFRIEPLLPNIINENIK